MKQNTLYLFKGLLFSTLLLLLSTLLLGFLMMKTGWGDPIMYPLLVAFFCISTFIGGRYFAKHAPSKRFIWGTLFGAIFFAMYLFFSFFLSNDTLFFHNYMTFLIAAVVSGCLGGMLS